MKISIIIVSYNSLKDLKVCLRSIQEQDLEGAQLIIVDNASTDGTLEWLKQNSGKCKLILNSSNKGFCRANNSALKVSEGEYVLFLNPDVILEKNAIDKLINTMDINKNLGSVTGKLLRDKESGEIDSTGIIFKKYSFIPIDRGEGEKDLGQYSKEEYIFGPSCACALYRRKALDDIAINDQYFDEDFFIYFEDVDIAWRTKQKGWKSKYIDFCVGYHSRKGDGSKSMRIKIHAFKNAYLAVIKNAKRENISFCKVTYNFLAMLKNIIMKPYLFVSLLEIFRLTPRMIKKRKH